MKCRYEVQMSCAEKGYKWYKLREFSNYEKAKAYCAENVSAYPYCSYRIMQIIYNEIYLIDKVKTKKKKESYESND